MTVTVTIDARVYDIQSAHDSGLIAHSRLQRFPERTGLETFVDAMLEQNPQEAPALRDMAGLAAGSGKGANGAGAPGGLKEVLKDALVGALQSKTLLVTRSAQASGGGASRPPTATPVPVGPKATDTIDGSRILSVAMKTYLKGQPTQRLEGKRVASQPPSQKTPSGRPGNKDYEAVIEVAGLHLSRKQSLQIKTPQGDSVRRYPANDPRARHRSLVHFTLQDNQPVGLTLAIPMKGWSHPLELPLLEDMPVYGKGTRKALWDNVLVPVKPLQFLSESQQKHESGLLQNGWLYVFWNGRLWRELKVSGNGVLQDVDLEGFRASGSDQREAEGHHLDSVWVPYRLNGVVQTDIRFAASVVQWSWNTIRRAEQNPDQTSGYSARLAMLETYEQSGDFDESSAGSGSIRNAALGDKGEQKLLHRQQRQKIAAAYLPKVGATLNILLKDDNGNTLPNVDFEVALGGRRVQSRTDNQGVLSIDVPADIKQSDIHFYRKTPDDSVQEFTIRLNELAPVATVQGLQARLNNLGFDAGVVDGINGRRTKAATREFQARHDLQVDGISGPQTRSKLLSEHQS